MRQCYAFMMALLLVCGSAYGQQRLIINEFLADPPADLPGDANGDGTRSASQDEFVELANASSDTLDLTGWKLGDDEAINFTFPNGYKVPPRGLIVVFGGGDITNVPGYNADPMITRAFSADSTVGNGLANGGEYIIIQSPDGSEDAWLAYGSNAGVGAPSTAATAGITFEYGTDVFVPGNEDVAVVRSPDGNTQDADPWVKHSDVSADLFSPGLTIGGSEFVPKQLPPLTIVINEVLADPPTDPVGGDANGDGVRSASQDEFVELANVGENPVDIGGWQLGDDEGIGFTFPDGYTVQPRSFVVVFGGGDVSNVPGYNADPLVTKVFSADSTVGNGLANGGEIVILLSDDGSYDTWLAYGTMANTGGPTTNGVEYEIEIDVAAPANADNSITRFPDGDTNVIDPFVQHLTVSNSAYSPGRTVDGKNLVPLPTPPVTVVINEVLANAAGAGDANKDGVVDGLQDQFIEIVNTSEDASVNLSGWQVGDEGGLTFTFPAGYFLEPQDFVAVFGGGDLTNAPGYSADPLVTRVFAASGSLGNGLDASGDYAVVVSADGTYNSYVAFGSKSGAGDPTVVGAEAAEWQFGLSTAAPADQSASITRDPDGDIFAADPFVVHSAVSTLLFSPAQTTDGLNALDDFVDVPHPWGTGHVLHFTKWEHDRVVVEDAASLVPLRMDQGTIEMWFRPDSLLTNGTHGPDFTYLFSKNISGNVEGDLGLSWRRGEGRMLFFIQDGTSTTDLEQSNRVDEVFYPRWYHVAGTWNTADSMRLFIDGKKVATIESSLPVFGGTQPFAIGSGATDLFNDRFETFQGMIDEVRFSIVERYTDDFDLPTEPFVEDQFTLALWHFDEGAGEVTADATGNGFEGTLGGLDGDGNADPNSIPAWVDAATLVATEAEELPDRYTLEQNYPNPFNPVTNIRYTVPRASDVKMEVYNVLGQRVSVLVDGTLPAGEYQVGFDGSQLASGVYFYVLRATDTRLVHKMVLLK